MSTDNDAMPTKIIGHRVSPSGNVYEETRLSGNAQISAGDKFGGEDFFASKDYFKDFKNPITATSTQAEDEAAFARQNVRVEEEVEHAEPETPTASAYGTSNSVSSSAVSPEDYTNNSPNENVNSRPSAAAPTDDNTYRDSAPSGRASSIGSRSDHSFVQSPRTTVGTLNAMFAAATRGDNSSGAPTSLPENTRPQSGWKSWFTSVRDKTIGGLTGNNSNWTRR